MSQRSAISVLSLALLGVVVTGCSASESDSAKSASAHDSMSVGARSAFTVFAHCGVEFTTIDGDTWRTRPRDDGQGNPPAGWPDAIRGTLTRQSEDRAVFTSDAIPVTLIFKPAPHAKYSCE